MGALYIGEDSKLEFELLASKKSGYRRALVYL
jgi:hypothetical protein